MSLLPDRVQSERLVLRRWQHDEAAILDAVVTASIDHLRPWMSWIAQEPLTIAERVALIEGWTRSWEDGGDVLYGVILDGEAIGSCGMHRRVGPRAIEIGYWIAVDHTRNGYATELLRALTDAAFAIDEIEQVVVVTDETNIASARVPEKLGFERERIELRAQTAPSETGRMIIWTMSQEAWPASTGP